MALLITYVAFALFFSFMCSIMEAVLLSVTPSYIEVKEQQGHSSARLLKELKMDIDRPLAAILSLNTVAHTVGAALAGAQAAVIFGKAYIAVISIILTLLILIISEILPKTLGALYWRSLAPVVARVLVPLIWTMWPLVKLSQGMTRLLSRGKSEASVSREEITALADLGHREGTLEADESRILKNLFRFGQLCVRDVMTPRIVVFALPESHTIRQVMEEHQQFQFSRIPIYRDSRDDVSGYVLKDEILLRAAQEDLDTTLLDMRRDMTVVPDVMKLSDLFEQMLDSGEHIALVVDEYGGVEGIATMEDVVETLLGLEIVDEVDSVEDMQALARQQWVRRARRLGLITDDAENDTPPSRPHNEEGWSKPDVN